MALFIKWNNQEKLKWPVAGNHITNSSTSILCNIRHPLKM